MGAAPCGWIDAAEGVAARAADGAAFVPVAKVSAVSSASRPDERERDGFRSFLPVGEIEGRAPAAAGRARL
jgi:hypothetical protein